MKYKFLSTLLMALLSYNSYSQENAKELAQKLQNPLANLIAVPVLHNFGFEASQNKELAYNVSFQPIFPLNFEQFNIIKG